MSNGIIQCVHDTLINTLARCHAWQHWAENDWTEEQAKARIYEDALPAPASNAETHTLTELQTLRPFILIDTNNLAMSRDADGWGYDQRGKLVMQIEQDVPSGIASNPREIGLRIRRDVGKLLRSDDPAEPGLAELADVPGNLVVRSALYVGYARTDETQVASFGDAIQISIELDWGGLQ